MVCKKTDKIVCTSKFLYLLNLLSYFSRKNRFHEKKIAKNIKFVKIRVKYILDTILYFKISLQC